MPRFVFTRSTGPRFTFTKTAAGTAGPNVISDSTTAGSLTAVTTTPFLVGANTGGTAARKFAGTGSGQVPTWDGSKWTLATPTGTGTVTSVNITAPAAGITASGGPITSTGSITLALADDLAALEALSGTNTIYYRSAASTWTAVTIGTNLTFSGGTLSATGGGGSGDVVGPSSATDEAIARFDGTTGKLIQNSLRAFVSDAGTVTLFPAGMTPATTTDVLGAAAFPNGTTHPLLVYKSPRPETVPDYGVRINATDNPSSTVDDITVSTGWNTARNTSLPMAWRATEMWYNPSGTDVIEDHVAEGGWPAASYWTSDTPRRAISVELFKTPGGGFNNLVNVGMDTDSLHLQSVSRRTVAGGGSGGPVGSFFYVTQSISDGSSLFRLLSNASGAANDLLVNMNVAGYTLFETSRDGGDIYFRPTGAATVYLGNSAGNTRIMSMNLGFFGGSAASKPSDLSGLAGLNLVTAATLPAANIQPGAAGKGPRSDGSAVSNTFPAGDLTTTNSGAFNMATSQRHVRTLDGTNGTLSLSNDADGMSMTLCLKQDATGGRTVTWFSGITTWFGTASPSTPPTLSTAAGKRDYVTVIRHASGDYDAFFAKGS